MKFVKERLEQMGHVCRVLNIGQYRKIESPDYDTVMDSFDYLLKNIRYNFRNHKIHIHVNGSSPKGFVLALIAEIIPLFFFRRSILTFHAGPSQIYFPQKNSKLFAPILYLIFVLPKAIICNDEKVKEKIVGYGIERSKIFPIPAFSRQYLDFKKVQLSADLEAFIGRHETLISTYMLFRKEFRHESVFKCLKRLLEKKKNVGLVVVGGTPEEEDGGHTVHELVDKLGISSNIFFTGNLNRDQFMTLLKQSTLVLRSAATDGVAASVLEALALGIPVVASHNGLRPDCVVEFELDNDIEMAEKIEYVLDQYNVIKAKLNAFEVTDTVVDEVKLLIGNKKK